MSNTITSNNLACASSPIRKHAQRLQWAFSLRAGTFSPLSLFLCAHSMQFQCTLSLQLWNPFLRRHIHRHKYIFVFHFLPIFLYAGFSEICWLALGLPQVSPPPCPIRASQSSRSRHKTDWQSKLAPGVSFLVEGPLSWVSSMPGNIAASCYSGWSKGNKLPEVS